MSWINDTKSELLKLDVSTKSLRKFGLVVGGVFLLIFLWFYFQESDLLYSYIFLILAAPLMVLGLLIPKSLKSIYKAWMGAAFAIGWVVSRVILFILFYLVILPIGLVSRIFGKDFLNVKLDKQEETYWHYTKVDKKNDYLRMH